MKSTKIYTGTLLWIRFLKTRKKKFNEAKGEWLTQLSIPVGKNVLFFNEARASASARSSNFFSYFIDNGVLLELKNLVNSYR